MTTATLKNRVKGATPYKFSRGELPGVYLYGQNIARLPFMETDVKVETCEINL